VVGILLISNTQSKADNILDFIPAILSASKNNNSNTNKVPYVYNLSVESADPGENVIVNGVHLNGMNSPPSVWQSPLSVTAPQAVQEMAGI
jgi:hypothetical protein